MESGSPQIEDVGEILVKVQEDLQQLKNQLLSQGDNTVDVGAVQDAISRTEEGIRNKTDQLLQQLNNRVLTLPNLDKSRNNGGIDMIGWRAPTSNQQQSEQSRNQAQIITLRKLPDSRPPPSGQDVQVLGPTPGQATRHNYNAKVMMNPYNSRNRDVLHDSYGIQLPTLQNRKTAPNPLVQVVRGATVESLAVLPRANRVDPQLLPPPISEEDARRGILSLIERGLIPAAADLTLDPSPVHNQIAPLHDPTERDVNKYTNSDPYGSVKVDLNTQVAPSSESASSDRLAMKEKSMQHSRVVQQETQSRSSSGVTARPSASKYRTPVMVKTLQMPLQPMPPPTTPASAPDFKDKQHRFAVQHGRVRDNTQEYQAFKQHYCLSWGSIVTMIKHVEKMMTNFSVPLAFVNGDKLADLSLEFELERPPTVDDLLTVIVNREDVESIIRKPGRRFIGPHGRDLAASKIQSTFRMYKDRNDYLEYRRKKWAAGVIAISWVMHVKMSKVRKQLKQTRADQIERFKERSRAFSRNWSRIKSSKRVIIHLPSLGYSHKLREAMLDFNIYQNGQMARICDVKDPNVEVIYVSPVAVNEDMAQYYAKLLSLKEAIDSGDVENQRDISDKYKIITPEAINSFPSHRMCLSTILKYSDRTLKRIKHLIRGREAYVITGMPHEDDVYLSDYFDIPVLCPEPEVAHLYTTKSGSKRIFASANVPVPPSEYDIYSLPQLHECLAQLVTENLEVTRWLFKLDDEFDGRGIAYLDVADHLPCYPWAMKEAIRYGEKWKKKWAQEAAYIKIHAEIPDVLAQHTTPCNTERYPTWQAFLEAFLGQGGVIEACPPSESITALTVDMLIEPDGKITLVNNGDQIHADSMLQCWGLSVPQSSVEPDHLNNTCNRVAESCKARGVLGYFSIDFLTFIHPKTLQQEVWAVDLDLAYTDYVAMHTLMEFTSGGRLDPNTHYFDIPPPKKEEKKTRRRRLNPEEEKPLNTNRFAVMSTRLQHTNLSVVHYSVFFQMCRAHGIGFDIKEKQGSVFTLIDGSNRENLGMLSVSDNLQGALATFARNLSVIHQEISAPNMQGTTNFKAVIEDIEAILGTTVQNQEDTTDKPSQAGD